MSANLWNTPFKEGYGWEVTTECGQTIQLAKFNDVEMREKMVHCPMHYGVFGQLEKVVKFKRIYFKNKEEEKL
ncbi:MAG: hypothetical protein ABSB71_07910 [Candidatus Bathyarchaeia archaeon]|jgi:hypothetical protein